MSTGQNKALFARFIEEFFTRGNISVADELVAADFVEHEEISPDVPQNREGLKQMGAMFRSAFPDLRATVEDMIAEDDKVVARVTYSGTQTGEFMGIPPTGKRMSVTGIDIVRMVGGKTVEHWGQMDGLSMMQQLGAMPGPGQQAG